MTSIEKPVADIATGYPIIEFFLTVCGVALFDRNGGSLASDWWWLKACRNNQVSFSLNSTKNSSKKTTFVKFYNFSLKIRQILV